MFYHHGPFGAWILVDSYSFCFKIDIHYFSYIAIRLWHKSLSSRAKEIVRIVGNSVYALVTIRVPDDFRG